MFPALIAAVSFAAPAGMLPAQPLRGSTFDAILPSGRVVTPAGTSAVAGTNALGLALSPDGRYAIVSNDDRRVAGFSLGVVDLATMREASRYQARPGESFWVGVAALRDPAQPSRTLVFAAGGPSNAVYVFSLEADGRLVPETPHLIAIPGGPETLLASRDGRRVYAVDAEGDTVATIDVARRALAATPQRVGFSPFGAALAGDRLLITNEGLSPSGPDLARASSLSLLALGSDGTAIAPAGHVPMDPAPDGLRNVGGAHPTAIATTADGAYAFVAMANVDRIATVALGASPHVVGGTELRLFNRGPYGTQPAAVALAKDGSRLYVALAGLDAVAVLDARDPMHLHRLGLIPTGWYPSALALADDDRTLYVVDTKGFGRLWSTVQKIDLASIRLGDATLATLKNARRVVPAAPTYPAGLRNVVTIVEESSAAARAPNHVALAREYASAGNLFADAEEPRAGRAFALAGEASLYTERCIDVRDPVAGRDELARAGTIFEALARRRLSGRDYGTAFPAPGGDAARAAAFLSDYAARAGAGAAPRYAALALSGDDDAALGQIVAGLSRLPTWRATALFVVPAAAPPGVRDDVYRTGALVVSPYAKRGYVGMRHLSTVSVLKTSEQILGLGTLALGDLLATDMSDFFTARPRLAPYTAAGEALPPSANGGTP